MIQDLAITTNTYLFLQKNTILFYAIMKKQF